MKKICKVEGCDKPHWAKGYCRHHDDQVRRCGHILTYTRLDKNKIEVNEDVAIIVLCDTYGKEKARAIIDLQDLGLIVEHKWYMSSFGYPMTRINPHKQTHMHRIILSDISGMVIDHIDGNVLNNRRSNLRHCTHQQNIMNQKSRYNSATGFSGVNFMKSLNK